MDMYGFYTGRCFDAYEFLGCHPEGDGAVFRTFAPAAAAVSVIGECNGWTQTPMWKIHDGNFWECRISGAAAGQMYKYRIYRRDGSFIDHCDPYGFGMELRPNSASIIRNRYSYCFGDDAWMKKREECREKPLNIYELHVGSWKKKGDGDMDWYRYDELAGLLVPYLKELGCNYVELMPLGEHPCDESWGYQQTGFYSPTSRYGTADDLKKMMDLLHQNEIGVILDFVPVHFAVDGYALNEYDGTALYEYPNSDVGSSEWGSRNFMHSRGEVCSFLQSCADYWLGDFHMDGLRMDAISNMIYWQGQPERGVNGNAVEFLRRMNEGLKSRHPGIILAAEDSTAFCGVTRPVREGGLGFDYKWDMGWMNDTLDYFRTGPEYRSRDYHKLTFSMMYYYDEKYLLPLSHDEVVHGKATIIQKMNGEYERKFPQARALYMYMYAHSGKKLNFMGYELGHFREWDEKRELDWDLTVYPAHDSFRAFLVRLNEIYREHPAFWKKDYERDGFVWLDCHQEEACVYAFMRTDGSEQVTAVFNFLDRDCEGFELTVPEGDYEVLLDSSRDIYGGCRREEEGKPEFCDGRLRLDLPAFSGLYLIRREAEK